MMQIHEYGKVKKRPSPYGDRLFFHLTLKEEGDIFII